MTKCIEEPVRGGFARQLFAIAGPIALLLCAANTRRVVAWIHGSEKRCATAALFGVCDMVCCTSMASE